ncbi:MAG: hypothetical protein ACKOYK_13715 [Cyanobium sp.]
MQKEFSKKVETLRQPAPDKTWQAEALRMHREVPGKPAYTVALELGALGFPNVKGRQVADLWQEAG